MTTILTDKMVYDLKNGAETPSAITLKEIAVKPIDTNICRICLSVLPKTAIHIQFEDKKYSYCSKMCHKKFTDAQIKKAQQALKEMNLKKQWKYWQEPTKTGNPNG